MNLRKMDLNLLLVFNTVYETRSNTKAAQRLGLTQSSSPTTAHSSKRRLHTVSHHSRTTMQILEQSRHKQGPTTHTTTS